MRDGAPQDPACRACGDEQSTRQTSADGAVENALAARYGSDRMVALWSARHKVILERRLWIAVLKAQRQLGLDVDESVIRAYEAVVEEVDLVSMALRERTTLHDVKARIDEFCALAGHERVHLAMTSRDLTENVEQLQIRESLQVIRDDLVMVMTALADLAERHETTLMVARTHNVAAQATTLGKRFADAASESMLAFSHISELIDRYPLRGMKGPVGTRLDQLDLLGSQTAAERLDAIVAEHLGFEQRLITCGQVYPRSLDLEVVSALLQAVAGAASLATTLRLMAGQGLVSEGFRDGQVGSSAMPHKANTRSCERIEALRCVIEGHLTMAASLSGRQWNDGDVSCSAARRVFLPDVFFAADGLLNVMAVVLEELEVDTAAIAAEWQRHLPVLATSRLLTALVHSGMGREQAHRLLAEPTRVAAEAAKAGRQLDPAALFDQIAADRSVPLSFGDLTELTSNEIGFIGTARSQSAEVVARTRYIGAQHPDAASRKAHLRY